MFDIRVRSLENEAPSSKMAMHEVRHRSNGRHFRHIVNVISSSVFVRLGPPVFTMTAIAAVVVSWNFFHAAEHLPDWAPRLQINPLPFSLTAPALSFLLVFRANASYARFDEARKLWGMMLNRIRDFTRQALSYTPLHQRPLVLHMERHLAAFPLALKHHLVKDQGELKRDLQALTALKEDEVAAVLTAGHRPNYILQVVSECLRNCHVDPYQRTFMDQNLTTFADDIGGCERIFKTPIPQAYTRMASRFLVVWHALLPLAIWEVCGWLTIPAIALSAACLFCIEEVGVLIEEPFSILPLDDIAASARNSIAELLASQETIRHEVAITVSHSLPPLPPPAPPSPSHGPHASGPSHPSTPHHAVLPPSHPTPIPSSHHIQVHPSPHPWSHSYSHTCPQPPPHHCALQLPASPTEPTVRRSGSFQMAPAPVARQPAPGRQGGLPSPNRDQQGDAVPSMAATAHPSPDGTGSGEGREGGGLHWNPSGSYATTTSVTSSPSTRTLINGVLPPVCLTSLYLTQQQRGLAG